MRHRIYRKRCSSLSTCESRLRARPKRLSFEPLEDRRVLALLGVTVGLPNTFYDSTGQTSYNATTHAFDVTSATPIAVQNVCPAPEIDFYSGSPTLQYHLLVDNAGNLIGGVAGDDLTMTGTVTIC